MENIFLVFFFNNNNNKKKQMKEKNCLPSAVVSANAKTDDGVPVCNGFDVDVVNPLETLLSRSKCDFKSLFDVGLPVLWKLYFVFGDEFRWCGDWWPNFVVVVFRVFEKSIKLSLSLFGELPLMIVLTLRAFGVSNWWHDCCVIILRCGFVTIDDAVAVVEIFPKSGEPDGRLGGKASRMVPVAWILFELWLLSARSIEDAIDFRNIIDFGRSKFVFESGTEISATNNCVGLYLFCSYRWYSVR